jgi:GDSL-like Lipase/Acylhydrolase family
VPLFTRMTPRLTSLHFVSFSVATTLALLFAAEVREPDSVRPKRSSSVGGSSSSGATGGGAAGSAGSAGAASIVHDAPGVIVVLGSSTSAGTGPKDPANAWVERYRSYLKTQFPNFKLTNLAVGGYTTYQIQPSDFVPAAGRPQPDKAHNITFALTLKPDALIINMPTNDTNANYPALDQLANFDRVTQLAKQNGIACWVTTTQPRSFIGDPPGTQQTKWRLLISVNGSLQQKYGDHTLDFWTQFAEPRGKLRAMWDAGDGTHMNDAAHALLVGQVIAAKIPEAILTAKH